MTLRYQVDNLINYLRRKSKEILPDSVIKRYRKIKESGNPSSIFGMLFDDSPFPWSSPNVWEEIVSFYSAINNPTIFEYGTGASSLNHIKNLIKKENGNYIGVEYSPEWFWIVAWSIERMIAQMKLNSYTSITTNQSDNAGNIDFSISTGNVKAIIKLRVDKHEYITTFCSPGDAIIIDGAYRKDCVKHILSQENNLPGSFVMLMEAGRGHPNWWEGQLYGENDYTEELNLMLNLGGKILHGNGIDNWPGCKRKSPKPPAYNYPYEACKLIIPTRNI